MLMGSKTGKSEGFELFLHAVNDKNSRTVIHKALLGLVVDKSWAYQNHVAKLALKRGPPAGQLALPEFVGPMIRALNGVLS